MCAQLGSFVTFVLNYVPAVEKTLALWSQSILHLIFFQCYTTRNDVAGINNKLRSCGLSLQHYSFQRFCSPCAVCLKLPINWKRASRSTSCQQVFGVMLEAHQLEWLQESTTDELSSNKHWLVSLFKWNQRFDSRPQKAIIINLQSLFLPLSMSTDQLGFVNMLSSVLGSLDSTILLCIAIFLNVQLGTESPNFAKSMANHRPTSNVFSFGYIVALLR